MWIDYGSLLRRCKDMHNDRNYWKFKADNYFEKPPEYDRESEIKEGKKRRVVYKKQLEVCL